MKIDVIQKKPFLRKINKVIKILISYQ